ncbi:MAG TPA: hypothetical protein VJL39_02190, partial [Candidatus Paceibacterota bacterium]
RFESGRIEGPRVESVYELVRSRVCVVGCTPTISARHSFRSTFSVVGAANGTLAAKALHFRSLFPS